MQSDAGTTAKMDNSAFQISFRFSRLNKMQALTLCREIEGVSYTESIESIEKTEQTAQRHFVALVALTAANLDAITMFYLRQGITLNGCDILVAVMPSAETGFTLPAIVNQMLKHIDCPLTISFLY